MSLKLQDIEKLAQLAKLKIQSDQISVYQSSLSNIVDMISIMEKVDTSGVTLHDDPHQSQYLREDTVTEPNQVALTELSPAPTVEKLYIVPGVPAAN